MSKREAEEGAAAAPTEKKPKYSDDAASEAAPVSADLIKTLEMAYKNDLLAFKADKTNKDLRRAKSASRKAWDAAIAATVDGEQLQCKDCSQMFIFPKEEKYFGEQQGWILTPTRCPNCNEANKDRLKDRTKRDSSGKNMCYDFQRGECTRGNRCKFSHDPNHAGSNKEAPTKPVCHAFQRGKCKLGDACSFTHPIEVAGK
jgi:hypothetical protein